MSQQPETLIPDALYSWAEIAPFVKVGRETWRRYYLDGTAPQPVRRGTRWTRWRGREVLEWINSPETYSTSPRPTIEM